MKQFIALIVLLSLILLATALVVDRPKRVINRDSLRSALNSLNTRKQRSINPRDYYYSDDDLSATKYYRESDDPDENVDENDDVAQQFIRGRTYDDFEDDDALAFVNSGVGDYHEERSNVEKQLWNRALVDYLINGGASEQDGKKIEDDRNSIFRERALTNSRKRSVLSNDRYEDSSRSSLSSKQQTTGSAYDKLYLKKLDGINSDDEKILTAQRRNVNARYLFNRDHDHYNMINKRFPVSKRSADTVDNKQNRETNTDPKLIEDLGSLFGNNNSNNKTTVKNKDRYHENAESVTENEIKKTLKSSNVTANTEREINLKKKSVDWSQYFGIDRRKKKTAYLAKSGTRDQDDEYLLQKYYETMAENLNSGENKRRRGGEEQKQILRYEEANDQRIKDEIMSRLAAAYSLEKLRRVLDELGKIDEDIITTGTTIKHVNVNNSTRSDKRNVIIDAKDPEFAGCLEIQRIDNVCNFMEKTLKVRGEPFHLSCVKYHVCNRCGRDDCVERYILDANKICQQDQDDHELKKRRCVTNTLSILSLKVNYLSDSVCRLLQTDKLCDSNLKLHPYVYDYNTDSDVRRDFTENR